MGLLDRLLGERNARAVQQVYDRTAQAANRGYDAASQGLSDLEAARLQIIAENKAKAAKNDMWYQKAGQGIGQFVDDVQDKVGQYKEYNDNFHKNNPSEKVTDGIRGFLGRYF